jgi:hypothetical protein
MAYDMLSARKGWRKVMGTRKTAIARALIDLEVKREAESLLKELGPSISFGAIPFSGLVHTDGLAPGSGDDPWGRYPVAAGDPEPDSERGRCHEK